MIGQLKQAFSGGMSKLTAMLMVCMLVGSVFAGGAAAAVDSGATAIGVEDENGDAVGGVDYTITNDADDTEAASGSTSTDGLIDISDLSDGDYTLTVTGDGYADAEQTFTVSSGETEADNVEMTETFTAVDIVDADGESVENASYTIEDGDTEVESGNVSDSSVDISDLSDGDYTLTVTHDDYADAETNLTVSDGAVETGEVTLESSFWSGGGSLDGENSQYATVAIGVLVVLLLAGFLARDN